MFLYLIIAIAAGFRSTEAEVRVGCPSTVYLEYRKVFTLNCAFPPTFESVFWYRIPDQGPFISYARGSKSGPGYESGEFDIEDDGSLVIHNVTLDHHRQLRVFVHYEEWENDIRQTVDLSVYVRARQRYPYIDVCKGNDNCHVMLEENELILCSVNETRPAADLIWLKKEGNKITTIPFENYKINGEYTTSSFASTHVSMRTNSFLEILTCQSTSPAPLLKKNHSLVLLEKYVNDFSSKVPTTRLSKVNNNFVLGLTKREVYAVVWKKRLPTGIYQTIGYYTYAISEVYDDVFHITDKGFLAIERFQLEYEGEYLAVYAASLIQSYERFQVHVLIVPTPPFPKVFGCSDVQHCVINVQRNGRLTCSLEGIRPLVHLEWVFNGKGVSPITFSSPLLSVANRGVTYDSTVTTSFTITSETNQKYIEVSCRVVDNIDGLSIMPSNITLSYISEYSDNTEEENCADLFRRGEIFLIVGASLTSLMSLLYFCLCCIVCTNCCCEMCDS